MLSVAPIVAVIVNGSATNIQYISSINFSISTICAFFASLNDELVNAVLFSGMEGEHRIH